MKKIFISSLVVLILTFSTLTSYQKASAAGGLLSMPGYADEMFKSIMTGVMVVGGAAAHAGNYVEDNLEAIVNGAGLAYEKLAPEAKELFLSGLSATADGIVVAGDWIDTFLSSASLPTGASTVMGDATLIDGYFTAYFSIPVTFTRDNGTSSTLGSWILKMKDAGSYGVSVEIWASSYTQWQGYLCQSGCTVPSTAKMSFAEAISIIRAAGFGATYSNSDIPKGELDNITNELDRLASNGGLKLGVSPNALVEPWTNTNSGPSRVYYDQTQDLWTLPDGTLVPNDQVQFRPAGQGIYNGTGVVVGSDGSLIDLGTGETVATKDEAQSSGGVLSPSITDEWEWQDTLVKEPAKEETGDSTTGTGEGLSGFFSALWEWLKKILDAILSIPEKIIELLKALLLLLFVPDADFLTGEIEYVKGQFEEKLGVLFDIKDTLMGAFKDNSRNPLSNLTLDLPILNKPVKLDTQLIETAVPTLKKIISGVMVLFTFLYIYRKITGRGGVMEK